MGMNVLPLDFKLPKGENHIYLTSFMAHLSQQCLKHRNTCVCYILLSLLLLLLLFLLTFSQEFCDNPPS